MNLFLPAERAVPKLLSLLRRAALEPCPEALVHRRMTVVVQCGNQRPGPPFVQVAATGERLGLQDDQRRQGLMQGDGVRCVSTGESGHTRQNALPWALAPRGRRWV